MVRNASASVCALTPSNIHTHTHTHTCRYKPISDEEKGSHAVLEREDKEQGRDEPHSVGSRFKVEWDATVGQNPSGRILITLSGP